MKKTTIIAAIFFAGAFTFAQQGRVGINTDAPKTTMDVTGKLGTDGKSLTTDITGLQAPRLTREELTNKGNTLYGDPQKGALIYITNISLGDAGATTPRKNINSVGYYYFDGTDWQKFLDTDTAVLPTGFERLPNMSATNFHWRLIGATAANYGTEGKYGLDATWNPADLTETIDVGGGFVLPYNTIIGLAGLTTANLGALGKNSFTAGAINSASGNLSTALGGANTTSGAVSFAAGGLNKSTGRYSASIGSANVSSGVSSFAAGGDNEATENASVAMGNANKASGENAVAIGQANNASAQGSVALGNTSTASAVSALAMGQSSTASGQASIAIGTENIASGQNALAIGRLSEATGQSSIAIGTVGNEASGVGSISVGNNTIAESAYTTAMGLYNTLETSPEPAVVSDGTKRLFVIGNGNSTTRSDAFTILRNGKTGIGENAPTNKLHVKDTKDPLRLEGVQETADVNTYALVLDNNGVVKTSFLQRTKFGGYINNDFVMNQSSAGTTIAKVIVDNEQLDLEGEYDTTTGLFTPVSSGVYTWEFAMTYHNAGGTSSPVDGEVGTSNDRGVIGIVDSTGKWISRAAYEAISDQRFFLAKGVVSLVAGQSYYFGAAAPTSKRLTILANPTGSTGSGIGTYFDFTRLK